MFYMKFFFSNADDDWKKTEQPNNCPCRNGGLCVQLPSYAIGCSCRYGYTGDQCEKSKKMI